MIFRPELNEKGRPLRPAFLFSHLYPPQIPCKAIQS